MRQYCSIVCCYLLIAVMTIAAPDVPSPTSKWPDKDACDVIAGKITAGMPRKDVELLLKPYKPYPWGGGGQGGPQSSVYVLAPDWALVIWYDLHRSPGIGNPTVLSPLDRVTKGSGSVFLWKPPFGPTEDELRQFQKLLQ